MYCCNCIVLDKLLLIISDLSFCNFYWLVPFIHFCSGGPVSLIIKTIIFVPDYFMGCRIIANACCSFFYYIIFIIQLYCRGINYFALAVFNFTAFKFLFIINACHSRYQSTVGTIFFESGKLHIIILRDV